MGGSRTLGKKRIGKSSQNSPTLELIFWGSIPCAYYLSIRYYKLLVIMILVFSACQ